jgi:hypothetical protein
MPYPAYKYGSNPHRRPDKRSAIGHVAGWRLMPYPAYKYGSNSTP